MTRTTAEKEAAARLKGVPLFANCSTKQRASIAKLGKIISWKEHSTVFALGRPALAGAMNTDPSLGIARLEAMAQGQRTIA